MGTKAKPKTGKRNRIKDLTPKHPKQVKGGKASPGEFSFVHKVDKSSPVLFQS
jgi:type VI protein secretion system component Hcp